jgi:type 2 lantibiotic biosynthesis protein LanM
MGAATESAEDVVARIVTRSRPLYEHVAATRAESWIGDATAGDTSRVAAWCAVVSNGDQRGFERRLSWDGLTVDMAARALAPSRTALDSTIVPTWARILADAYVTAHDHDAGEALGQDRACRADIPLPFERLLLPLVALGRKRVARRAASTHELASDRAHASLERTLLTRLATICARALYADFSVYRACRGQASFAAVFGAGCALFDAFTAEMLEGGMIGFFEQYPVAARICCTVTELWVDTVAELLRRLDHDLTDLQRTFNGGEPLGVVESIRASLSDPHEGGRGVMMLRWANGCTVAYKPRSIGLESCFAGLVRWTNARDSGFDLHTLTVVARPGYGWIEFAAHAPCETPHGAARYFERCGMLLCLTYLLNGSDFHYENLIAVGEQPVLIDMETLLGHRFELSERVADQALAGHDARRRSMESVLNVRLLPLLKIENRAALEVGGLGGPGDAGGAGQQVTRVNYWKNVNTDAMKLENVDLPMPPGGDNLPVLNGARVEAHAHVDAIVAGFERTYRVLLAHRSELTADDGPLVAFRRQRVRFILRNTSLYASALERCLHPRFLRDGADRGIQLDALSRVLLTLDTRPAAWPIIEAEQRALEQMDIPLFAATADSTSLTLPTGVTVPHCFRTSAYDEVLVRVGRLSRADLRAQRDLIRGSFRANAARDVAAPSAAGSGRSDCKDGSGALDGCIDSGPVSVAARSIEAACRAATAMRRTSLGSESEPSWLGVSYLAEARRYMLGPMSSNLFDGYAGVALFLAALERVTADGKFRQLALSAAAPLRRRLDELAQSVRMRRSVDVGAATGLGSLVYALVRIGEFLGEPDLLRDAARIGALISPASVLVDDSLDVVSGSAGGILGLLALHAAAPNCGALDLALAMGERLLDRRATDPDTGRRAFLTWRGHAEFGFAHGHAGISYALARLAHASANSALRDAAAETAETERLVLGERLAAAEAFECRAAWGRGATGIGLARLGSLDVLDTPETRAEIHAALEITRRCLLHGPDSLGCGVAGRVDFLISAAARLGRAELLDDALRAAGSVLERAGTGARFDTGWNEPDAWQVGLFHGAPGVCYSLLRAGHPGALPSLLLWS